MRHCDLGAEDFNNDPTVSGYGRNFLEWLVFRNPSIVLAPPRTGCQKIVVRVDGHICANANLATVAARRSKKVVAEISGRSVGEHTIEMVSRGTDPVAVDALMIH